MIAPVCQSFGVFPSFDVTGHTFVNQCTPSPFNIFNMSSRISSSSTAFPNFNPHMAAATSVNVKTSSFPKSIVSHVSVVLPLLGSANLYSILSNVKGFPFHPRRCSQLNP